MNWIGLYPVLNSDHQHGLERRAAVLEFHHGIPSHLAELQAHREYTENQHLKGAAHHYAGMKKSQSRGNIEDSNKHFLHYSMHLGKLGLNPHAPVDSRIMAYVDPDFDSDVFIPCDADTLLIRK